MSPGETVQAFVDAWNRLDEDMIYGLMADNIVYHNIPLQPVQGREAVRAYLAKWPVDEAEWELRNIAANGDIVLTERIDRFRRGDDRLVIPVMGAFEVAQGRITHWRDYFDMGAMIPVGAGNGR